MIRIGAPSSVIGSDTTAPRTPCGAPLDEANQLQVKTDKSARARSFASCAQDWEALIHENPGYIHHHLPIDPRKRLFRAAHQKRLADEHKTDQVARRRSSSGGACQPSPGTGSWNPDWRQLCLFLDPKDVTQFRHG